MNPEKGETAGGGRGEMGGGDGNGGSESGEGHVGSATRAAEQDRDDGRNRARHGGLPSRSIRRPIGTIMLGLVVVVLGAYFVSGLSLDLLPSIIYPTVRANVNNQGVAPEVLEETVAKPLENSLANTEDVVQIETEIQEGRVGVNLHLDRKSVV